MRLLALALLLVSLDQCIVIVALPDRERTQANTIATPTGGTSNRNTASRPIAWVNRVDWRSPVVIASMATGLTLVVVLAIVRRRGHDSRL